MWSNSPAATKVQLVFKLVFKWPVWDTDALKIEIFSDIFRVPSEKCVIQKQMIRGFSDPLILQGARRLNDWGTILVPGMQGGNFKFHLPMGTADGLDDV
jgi:hypothetical protein